MAPDFLDDLNEPQKRTVTAPVGLEPRDTTSYLSPLVIPLSPDGLSSARGQFGKRGLLEFGWDEQASLCLRERLVELVQRAFATGGFGFPS